MQSILNDTAMANNVAPGFLEFVGIQDERQTVGKLVFHFTIMDPAHRLFESTVVFIKRTVCRPELERRGIIGQESTSESGFSGN